MKFIKAAFVFAMVFLVSAQVIGAEKYNIKVDKSKVEWKARKVTGAHNGVVDIKSGHVEVDGEKVNDGSFEIDMTTIVNLDIKKEDMNKKLIGHLKSDDFFAVAKFPTSNFNISSVTNTADNNYTIKGDLTIKGITHEIEFPATIHKSGNGYHVSAEFQIDRSKWDVKFHSAKFFQNLGDKLIYDEIDYKLDLVFAQ
jgi:polyisoprenoid-binding protein YceI